MEVAKDIGDLSTFVLAVDRAGLVDTLNGEGPFTVFAPVNNGWSQYEKDLILKPEKQEELKEILLNHVIPKLIKVKDFPNESTVLETAGKDDICVTPYDDGRFGIAAKGGDTFLLTTDVAARNGVIHTVDYVYEPTLSQCSD